jgi:hypothetical protein
MAGVHAAVRVRPAVQHAHPPLQRHLRHRSRRRRYLPQWSTPGRRDGPKTVPHRFFLADQTDAVVAIAPLRFESSDIVLTPQIFALSLVRFHVHTTLCEISCQ